MVSLADALVTQKTKGTTRLEKIDGLINWQRFGYRLEKILSRSSGGRPPYPALSMFKAMILQRLYNFSDPEMEEMLYDRFSFRRFCGFGLTDTLPDETTICRFRGVHGYSLRSNYGAACKSRLVAAFANLQCPSEDAKQSYSVSKGTHAYNDSECKRIADKALNGTWPEKALEEELLKLKDDPHYRMIFQKK